MKIKGEFMLRMVAGENLLIPVGETALKFNGMVMLDPVGAVIWSGIRDGKSMETILDEILNRFDVDEKTAREDAKEFVERMIDNGLLEE